MLSGIKSVIPNHVLVLLLLVMFDADALSIAKRQAKADRSEQERFLVCLRQMSAKLKRNSYAMASLRMNCSAAISALVWPVFMA